jgi:hypothetical protein
MKFLRELHSLFLKYSIDKVSVENCIQDDRYYPAVTFSSNGMQLAFAVYQEGIFNDVVDRVSDYKPFIDDDFIDRLDKT